MIRSALALIGALTVALLALLSAAGLLVLRGARSQEWREDRNEPVQWSETGEGLVFSGTTFTPGISYTADFWNNTVTGCWTSLEPGA